VVTTPEMDEAVSLRKAGHARKEQVKSGRLQQDDSGGHAGRLGASLDLSQCSVLCPSTGRGQVQFRSVRLRADRHGQFE
jgi:hypothetical protein